MLQVEPSVDGSDLSPEERVLAVRKLFNLCDTDEPMFQHASNPKIVDVIADVLGTEDIKVYGDQLCACLSPGANVALFVLSDTPGIIADLSGTQS